MNFSTKIINIRLHVMIIKNKSKEEKHTFF